MRLRKAFEIVLALALAAGAAGCEQGRKAPPKTRVQVVNAAPNHPALNFLRVERVAAAEIPYGAASAVLPFDVDRYDFHVEIVTPGATAPSRISSFAAEIAADIDYTFVFAESATGGIEPIIVATPAATASAAPLAAVHAGLGLPAVDVFLEPPGADLGTATPIGRLGYRESATGAGRAVGDYVITVTEAGNAGAVLLSSPTVTLAAVQRLVLVVIAGAGEGIAPLRVAVVTDTPGTVIDQSLPGALRVVNAAADEAPRDVAVGTDFSPPLFADLPFGAASDYTEIPLGDQTLSVTPAGNPGVVEATATVAVASGRMYTSIISGAPGAIATALLVDDRRRIFDRAQLALYNAASQFSSITFYLLLPGTDPSTVAPVTALNAPGGTQYIGLTPGQYELLVRDASAQTVAGPQPITVTAGGIYAALVVNGPDSSSAGILLLDDFAASP